MRFLLQHTSQVATISIDHHTRTIPHGAVVYVSFHQDDNNNYITKIDTFIQKIQTTKRFRLPDSDKISASLSDTGGSILIIPNFTLYSRNIKGSSVDYTHSASYADAQNMWNHLIEQLNCIQLPVVAGTFGAHMRISAAIDGPINHLLDL